LGQPRSTSQAHVLFEIMKRPARLLFPVLLSVYVLAASSESVQAQTYGSDFHRVTVTVATITLLQTNIGSINLSITGSSVIAGQDLMTVSDQSSTLLWGTNSSGKKVTVRTNLAAPKYSLKVAAINPTSGTAASEVTLSTTSTDFLLNIGRSSGSCAIRYTALALASQGTGSDVHTITFTITNQ